MNRSKKKNRQGRKEPMILKRIRTSNSRITYKSLENFTFSRLSIEKVSRKLNKIGQMNKKSNFTCQKLGFNAIN